MDDVFDIIDAWNSRINIFRDHHYVQSVLLKFVLVSFMLWMLLGFDSGVGVLEDGLTTLPLFLQGSWTLTQWINHAYITYGRSFHFSSFVIYGLLFYGMSKHFHTIGLTKSRNIFYAIFLVVLNVSVFELIYMALFAHYQMNRNLLEWVIRDLWFLQQYFFMFLLGLLGFLAVYIAGHRVHDSKVIGRTYTFQANKELVVLCYLCFFLWSIWIYYPFSTQRVTIDDWTSKPLFPQTHYAYVNAELYQPNNLLHGINVLVKGLFALCQFYIFFRFRPVTQKNQRDQTLPDNVTDAKTL